MLKRTSIALTLCANFAASSLLAAPQIEVLSRIVWEPDVENFGGLSAVEVDDTGSEFVAVSDTGVLYQGTLKRDEVGLLNGATLNDVRPLLFENGERPKAKHNRDTEGLAMLSPSEMYIAAESNSRLLHYRQGKDAPKIEPLPSRIDQMPTNTGFEALAISPKGTLLSIPEGSLNIRTPFEIYERDANGVWSSIYQLPRHGGFRPVGADFGPDGHLYILSRAFNGLGFSTRIDRLSFENAKPAGYEPLFRSRIWQFDNLEGLTVWQAAPGDLRLYAISDDNFSSIQTTEIIEFRIKE